MAVAYGAFDYEISAKRKALYTKFIFAKFKYVSYVFWKHRAFLKIGLGKIIYKVYLKVNLRKRIAYVISLGFPLTEIAELGTRNRTFLRYSSCT